MGKEIANARKFDETFILYDMKRLNRKKKNVAWNCPFVGGNSQVVWEICKQSLRHTHQHTSRVEEDTYCENHCIVKLDSTCAVCSINDIVKKENIVTQSIICCFFSFSPAMNWGGLQPLEQLLGSDKVHYRCEVCIRSTSKKEQSDQAELRDSAAAEKLSVLRYVKMDEGKCCRTACIVLTHRISGQLLPGVPY